MSTAQLFSRYRERVEPRLVRFNLHLSGASCYAARAAMWLLALGAICSIAAALDTPSPSSSTDLSDFTMAWFLFAESIAVWFLSRRTRGRFCGAGRVASLDRQPEGGGQVWRWQVVEGAPETGVFIWVELAARGVTGVIQVGDLVEVYGRRAEGGLVRAHWVRNRSAFVDVEGRYRRLGVSAAVALILLVVPSLFAFLSVLAETTAEATTGG